jgi:glycosyltransferase involved in cell wall biosynthesis
VTLCIPTIGRTAYLEETLRSAVGQTYTRTEIIVLDNGSAPEAQGLLSRFARANPRAQILRSETRLPMFTNFNRGLYAASGQYITFLHDDDRYSTEFVAASVDLLKRHPNLALTGTNCQVLDNAGRVVGRRRVIKRTQVMSRRDFVRRQLVSNHNLLPTPGVMYRTEALLQNPFDEGLSVHFGDFVVLMRLAEIGGVGLIDRFLWQQRVHDEATSLGAPLSREIPARLKMLERYCAEYLSRWPGDAKLIIALRPAMRRSVSFGLMWGWVSAPNDEEAQACLDQLSAHGQQRMAEFLRQLQSKGFTTPRRRRLLMPFTRAAGRRFSL